VFVVNQELWSSSFYAQDDWKPTDKLTLNLGLRYDFMPPATEQDNRMANFDQTGSGALVYAKDGSLADRALVNPDKNNFAPRLGAIYRINDKTLLRGGYGMFFNQFERIGSEDQLALNPPGLTNIQVNSASGATTPVFFMKDGFPASYLDPSNLVIRNLKLRAAFQDSPRTMVQQFGAGIERELTGNMVVSADAVGSFTKNLAVLRNLNQPLPGTLDANGAVPYPNFGNIQAREMSGEANYKGVDLSFEKRFSDGYGYRASYTIGEARDQAPEHLNASSGRAQNSRDLESWEGPSDFDIRHRFVANFIVELPFGEGKKMLQDGVAAAIFGGWSVSGIYSARSGRAFTATQGNNNVGADQTGLPNLTGDPKGAETVAQWFNPAAFTLVPSGTFGNAGRNILRGPGWITFDTSIQRRITFSDRFNSTIRLDIFNVFNRANFGLPAANVAAAGAGVISSLAGDPRVMQLSVRFAF
jgi:outer membrane receptor protein involved in Fe transport